MPSIENMKLILGINDTSKDDVLTLYINRASNFVLDYCNIDESSLTLSLKEVIEDIAVFNYRNKGIENVISEGKGSLSESYRESLPSDIYRRLNEYRRMKFV